MHYRRLGRLGFPVSELASGTWGLDRRMWTDVDTVEAAAALALALERGVNLIDTAAAYGQSEEMIGDVLRSQQWNRHVLLATKVNPLVPIGLPSPHVHASEAYPGWHIRRSTEQSLRRLGVERLALQQLHAWSPVWLGEGDWLPTLVALRAEGKIAGFGVSLFDHDPDSAVKLVESGAVDCVQVMYNLFDQGAAAALFAACLTYDVGVIVRSPFYAGALSSDIHEESPFRAGDWRAEYFYPAHLAETRMRVAALECAVRSPDRSVQDLALRFCLSHPAVSTVAVGMRQRRHVYANLRVLGDPLLSENARAQLAHHAWLS